MRSAFGGDVKPAPAASLWGQPTDEPVVFGWMPAASLYFRDPDGNMLELLSMLPDSPQPELGIVGWSRWNEIHESAQGR